MANLSQQKRQRMLDFLDEIKRNYLDEKTVNAVREIEHELTEKKYGLVWEKHEEEIDVQMRSKIPVFTEVKNREIVRIPGSDHFNFLLEGDNLHSLKLLEKTHKNRIDVIYIDPPYNTGNRDFMYDDAFVKADDSFKHSMWLSFMEERLNIARQLLSDTGVMFISIDDNELYPLKMLCDEIFGDDAFVANMIWQKKTGASDARGIATITEYILVYVKNSSKIDMIFDKNYEAFNLARYRFEDEHVERRGKFYFDSLDRGSVRYSDSLNYGIEAPDGTQIFPNGRTEFVNDGWTWKWSKEKVLWGMKHGFIDIAPSNKKGNGWAVRYKIYLNVDNEDNLIDKSAPYKNMVTSVLNANAAADIKSMFDGLTVFQYSKPVELIKLLLSYVKNKNGMVLDFFAGSGTTGQAVLEQNLKDRSNRSFILCTNNQNRICEEITYERLQKRIDGFSYKGKKETILYEKSLVLSDLKDSAELLYKAKEIMDKNAANYSSMKQTLKDGVFKVIGVEHYVGEMTGIPANLKYYRTDFIPKSNDNTCYSVAKELARHIKEMVQLEFGIDIQDNRNFLLLTKDHLDYMVKNIKTYQGYSRIYMSSKVALSAKQVHLLSDRAIINIPDYYSEVELQS